MSVDEREITEALRRARLPGAPRLEVLAAPPARLRRVGVVAGSFDPLTAGHAALAEALFREGMDTVLLLYAARTLPKERASEAPPPLLPPTRRVAAVAAYCAAREGLVPAVCSHGRYVEHAEAAASAFPGAEITLGMGSDKLVQVFDPRWYDDRDADLDRLFSLATVAYAVREGDEDRGVAWVLDRDRRWRDRVRPIEVEAEVRGVSSSGVRERLARGEHVAGEVPGPVLPFLGHVGPGIG